MAKKKIPDKSRIKKPQKEMEIKHPADPEEPLNIPDEDPDIIPDDEDLSQGPPPYEKLPPGEGP